MKTLAQLLEAVHGVQYEILSSHKYLDSIYISSLAFDSRVATAGGMFFCLSGSISDGHAFADMAYAAGCRCFAVERELPLPSDAVIIKFKSTRSALSHVSAEFYSHPDREMHVIGITGTKGKTTTALLIHKMLESCGIRSGYIGTNGISFCGKHFNTVNTTPESLELFKYLDYMRHDGVGAVVIEVSSQALWTCRVQDLHFDTCIYTNLYPDHIGNNEHPSFEHYKKTKRSLFRDFSPSTVIVNSDDGEWRYMVRGSRASIITTSADGNDGDWRAENVREVRTSEHLGVSFTARRGDMSLPVLLDLPGKINVGNALLLFALCCDVFDISPLTVAKNFEGMTIDGRGEVLISPALPDVTFVIDYAHNGASLAAILGVLRGYDPTRLICLFGSVGERTFMRRGELARAAAEGADICILTSDNPGRESPEKIISEIDAEFPEGYPQRICIPDRREAIEYAVRTAEAGDIILLAGKGHEDYQLIGIRRVPFCERDIINSTIDGLFAVGDGEFSKNY